MLSSYLYCFFGGAFLANALPHLVAGMSGRAFPTPFANPPGQGESSSFVNVLWGAFNLAAAYGLLCILMELRLDDYPHVTATGAGALLLALFTAWRFGPLYGGRTKK